jgi:hypothetical protein
VSRQFPEKFQVAFSLAGEQRNLVRGIAKALERELGESTVFLDEWFEYYIAGHDRAANPSTMPAVETTETFLKKALFPQSNGIDAAAYHPTAAELLDAHQHNFGRADD